jgi:hypothetical protein
LNFTPNDRASVFLDFSRPAIFGHGLPSEPTPNGSYWFVTAQTEGWSTSLSARLEQFFAERGTGGPNLFEVFYRCCLPRIRPPAVDAVLRGGRYAPISQFRYMSIASNRSSAALARINSLRAAGLAEVLAAYRLALSIPGLRRLFSPRLPLGRCSPANPSEDGGFEDLVEFCSRNASFRSSSKIFLSRSTSSCRSLSTSRLRRSSSRSSCSGFNGSSSRGWRYGAPKHIHCQVFQAISRSSLRFLKISATRLLQDLNCYVFCLSPQKPLGGAYT